MDNLNTINVYNRHVKDYVNKFMGLDLYKDTFDYFLKVVQENANILELGCGPGNVVKYLKSKRGDLNFLGIDLAPEMIKEAKLQNPDAKFEVMDVRNIAEIKKEFDAIITAFCLPYISYTDVDALFKNMSALIENDGLLYLSCMEGPRDRSGFEKTSFTGASEIYISYYERGEIESLLKENNFHIEAFYTKDYPEQDGSTTTDLIYISKKRNV